MTDEQINDSRSLLLVGHGDDKGSYGAGPTRDMRRADYLPFMVVVQDDAAIGGGRVFRTVSDFTKSFAGRLDSLGAEKSGISVHAKHVYPTFSASLKMADGTPVSLDIGLANVHIEKGTVIANQVLIFTPPERSGQEFLPDDVRGGSPLFGSLSYAMGGAEQLMDGPVKSLHDWLGGVFRQMKEASGKLTGECGKRLLPLVSVWNS